MFLKRFADVCIEHLWVRVNGKWECFSAENGKSAENGIFGVVVVGYIFNTLASSS